MNKFIVIGIGVNGEYAAMNTVTLQIIKPKADYTQAERSANYANAVYHYTVGIGKAMPWHQGGKLTYSEFITFKQGDLKC